MDEHLYVVERPFSTRITFSTEVKRWQTGKPGDDVLHSVSISQICMVSMNTYE